MHPIHIRKDELYHRICAHMLFKTGHVHSSLAIVFYTRFGSLSPSLSLSRSVTMSSFVCGCQLHLCPVNTETDSHLFLNLFKRYLRNQLRSQIEWKNTHTKITSTAPNVPCKWEIGIEKVPLDIWAPCFGMGVIGLSFFNFSASDFLGKWNE